MLASSELWMFAYILPCGSPRAFSTLSMCSKVLKMKIERRKKNQPLCWGDKRVGAGRKLKEVRRRRLKGAQTALGALGVDMGEVMDRADGLTGLPGCAWDGR